MVPPVTSFCPDFDRIGRVGVRFGLAATSVAAKVARLRGKSCKAAQPKLKGRAAYVIAAVKEQGEKHG
jgi:hypothetical protein